MAQKSNADSDRVRELEASLAQVTGQNERLVAVLREARDQIVALKEVVDDMRWGLNDEFVLEVLSADVAEAFRGGRELDQRPPVTLPWDGELWELA